MTAITDRRGLSPNDRPGPTTWHLPMVRHGQTYN